MEGGIDCDKYKKSSTECLEAIIGVIKCLAHIISALESSLQCSKWDDCGEDGIGRKPQGLHSQPIKSSRAVGDVK